MKWMQKSFTCLGSESNTYTHARAVCGEHGHMAADVRGKCLRCGERVVDPGPADFSKPEDWGS